MRMPGIRVGDPKGKKPTAAIFFEPLGGKSAMTNGRFSHPAGQNGSPANYFLPVGDSKTVTDHLLPSPGCNMGMRGICPLPPGA